MNSILKSSVDKPQTVRTWMIDVSKFLIFIAIEHQRSEQGTTLMLVEKIPGPLTSGRILYPTKFMDVCIVLGLYLVISMGTIKCSCLFSSNLM